MKYWGLLLVASVVAAAATGAPQIAHASTTPAPTPTPTPTSGTCSTSEQHAGTTTVVHIRVGGRKRTFRLSSPRDDHQPAPLILAFHGRGQSGAQMQRYSGLSRLNAWVAFPDGIKHDGQRAWEGAPYASNANDVAFTKRMITSAESRGCIDPQRVDAVGISNGGGFAALLACRIPTMIAAFAAVDGAFYAGTHSHCSGRPVPTLEFHGTADPVIHYGGGSGAGGTYPSVTTWLGQWVHTDRCRTEHTRRVTASVARETWSSCAGDTNVVHYRIAGGGHTWPGASRHSGPGKTDTSISARRIMGQFFADHPART